MQIVLQPVAANLDYDSLHSLGNHISKEFENIQVTVGPSDEPYMETIFQ